MCGVVTLLEKAVEPIVGRVGSEEVASQDQNFKGNNLSLIRILFCVSWSTPRKQSVAMTAAAMDGAACHSSLLYNYALLLS